MHKALIAFGLISLGCFSGEAQTYTELPAFPSEARDDAVTELIDGNIYYGTGYDAFFQPRKDFWRYSIQEQQWERLADAPFTPRQYSSSATIGSSLFVIAGWTNAQNFHREIWCFETAGQNWAQMNDFPGAARWGAVATENAGFVYFGLGRDTTQRFNDWWRYNPETDQWKALPDFPGAARNVAFAEAMDHQVWVGLGEDASNNALNDLWVFDTRNLIWRQEMLPVFPALKHPATAVLKDAIYIAGGEAPDTLTTDLLQLKPGSELEFNNYGSLGFHNARGGNMLSDGCRLYLIGGLSVAFQRLNDFGIIEFPPFEEVSPEIYPNPAVDEITVLHSKEAELVQVFDATGKLVLETPATCDQTEVLVNNLSAGVHFLRWCGEGCSEVTKFVVTP